MENIKKPNTTGWKVGETSKNDEYNIRHLAEEIIKRAFADNVERINAFDDLDGLID